MEQGFIDILKKVAEKHGKEHFLETAKCKGIVSDYTGVSFRKERGLLLRAVEAGVSRAINSAQEADLESCMKAQQRDMEQEQYMSNAASWDIVNVLAYILRGVEIKEVKTAEPEKVQTQSTAQPQGTLSKPDTNRTFSFDEAVGLFYDEKYDEARLIFEALAETGHAVAQYNLGVYYFKGLGVQVNLDKSFALYQKAAEQGYAMAQDKRALCYQHGRGTAKNWDKAVEWYQKAANKGDAYAQNNLADCYENGIVVKQDLNMAIEWYRKSADQGYAAAKKGLGDCYSKKQDLKTAVEWYRKAADEGYANAKKALDKLKEEGKI